MLERETKIGILIAFEQRFPTYDSTNFRTRKMFLSLTVIHTPRISGRVVCAKDPIFPISKVAIKELKNSNGSNLCRIRPPFDKTDSHIINTIKYQPLKVRLLIQINTSL
jgi:hypothetical protein